MEINIITGKKQELKRYTTEYDNGKPCCIEDIITKKKLAPGEICELLNTRPESMDENYWKGEYEAACAELGKLQKQVNELEQENKDLERELDGVT